MVTESSILTWWWRQRIKANKMVRGTRRYARMCHFFIYRINQHSTWNFISSVCVRQETYLNGRTYQRCGEFLCISTQWFMIFWDWNCQLKFNCVPLRSLFLIQLECNFMFAVEFFHPFCIYRSLVRGSLNVRSF